jgi:glycerophosphoryl diester phosphodiesterase
MTANILRQHQAESSVMLTVHTAEQARFYYGHNPNRMFSAFIITKQEFQDFEKSGVAFLGRRLWPM